MLTVLGLSYSCCCICYVMVEILSDLKFCKAGHIGQPGSTVSCLACTSFCCVSWSMPDCPGSIDFFGGLANAYIHEHLYTFAWPFGFCSYEWLHGELRRWPIPEQPSQLILLSSGHIENSCLRLKRSHYKEHPLVCDNKGMPEWVPCE